MWSFWDLYLVWPQSPSKPADGQCCFHGPILLQHLPKTSKTGRFAGMNSTQQLEVANKAFISQDREAQQEADRRTKQKASLMAAALGNSYPNGHPAPSWKGGTCAGPPWGKTNVHTIRRLVIGKTGVLMVEKQKIYQRENLQPAKKSTNPSLLWGISSDWQGWTQTRGDWDPCFWAPGSPRSRCW